MTETRIVKIVMVGSLALLAGLVTLDNLTDYENETQDRAGLTKLVERSAENPQSSIVPVALDQQNSLETAALGLPDSHPKLPFSLRGGNG
jgi:hypothetical protein